MNQVIDSTNTIEEELQISDDDLIQQEFQLLLDDYNNSKHKHDIELIERAFNFANKAHAGVRRRSGEPYMMHPLAVARIVIKEIGLGTTSICAALLHDVVEDTDYTVEDISNLFNPKIATIVDGLTKIAGGVFGEQASSQAENFRKLLLTISDDLRVIMIKIADRLHNMRTLSSMPAAKQYKIAGETLYIYAPLAYRLGLFKIKTELEDLSFKYEHPEIFEQIRSRLAEGDTQREDIYNQFIHPIESKLKAMGYEFEIEQRVKTIYSIWNKMKTKNIPFEEVYDLLAVRIIYKGNDEIDEKNQAWMIYSTVTSFYRPHPERIRDWVSTPKANGYEALHVTVMGPDGHWIEVQIRSERMHDIAERGLSAHWKYKAGEQSPDSELDKWLKTIKEILENPEPSAIDFLDTFKLNLFATEIFVFTPKGEIRTLPQGATALDFAFSLHSDLGLQCIGAKVNYKLVPLNHILDSGDQVEILTSKKQTPTQEWLNYVTTARAKTKLKSVFKKEARALAQKGKEIFEDKFKELEIPLDNQHIQLLLKHFKLSHREELFYEIGKGIINLTNIEKKIFKKKSDFRWKNYWKLQFGGSNKKAMPILESEIKPEKIDRKKTLKINDEGLGNVKYNIASCCNPIPGDDVLGYINNDETVTLHKRQCPVAAKLKSNYGERLVSAEWTSTKALSYPATIEVKGIDGQGVLSQMVKVISEDHAVNIRNINIETKGGIFEGKFQIYVHSTEDVNTLCMNILKIKAVNSVKRKDE